MFLHAEEFNTREAARRRYLQISDRLRADRDRELGCYNLLFEGRRPVVVIIAPEAPPEDVLAGWSGKTVELPRAFWEMLALRHGLALDQQGQQPEGTCSGPDGHESADKPAESPPLSTEKPPESPPPSTEKPAESPRLEEWEEWGVHRRGTRDRK